MFSDLLLQKLIVFIFKKMRNLALLTELQHRLTRNEQFIKQFGGTNLLDWTLQTETRRLYFLNDHWVLFEYSLSDDKCTVLADLQAEPDLFESVKSLKLISIDFHPDLEAICLATSDGKIITRDFQKKEVENVGEISTGILAMRWSPDFELVAFVTGVHSVLVMTKDWEILSETPIFPTRNFFFFFSIYFIIIFDLRFLIWVEN